MATPDNPLIPTPSAPGSTATAPTGPPAPATPAVAGTPVPVSPQPLIAGVSDGETVQGQLKTILSEDGPLLQNARTRAQEAAAARGLQNSSLAAGAGERALIETAAPIASQDATANFNRTSQNLTTQNQFGLQEAGLQGQMKLGEQNFGFQTKLADQDLAAKKNLLSQDTQARVALLAQEGTQRLQEIAAQTKGQEKLQMLDQQHQLLMQDRAAGLELKLEDKKFQQSMALMVADYGQRAGLSTLEQAQQIERMNVQHAQTLEEINAQAAASRSNNGAALGSQYLGAVSDRMHAGSSEISSIYQTQGLSSAQQTAAVNNAYSRMRSDIAAIGSYYQQSPDWDPGFATAPAPAQPVPVGPIRPPILPGRGLGR